MANNTRREMSGLLMSIVFLIGVISSGARFAKEVKLHEKLFPERYEYYKKSQSNVIMSMKRDNFDDAIKEMDAALRKNVPPCTLYDPKSPNFVVSRRRISEIKCLQNIWDVKYKEEKKRRDDQCYKKYPKLFSRILRGQKSKPGEYSHMGAIGWKDEESGKWAFKCGSFLVSNKFVLTAAHCYIDEDGMEPKIVRFGVINIVEKNPDQPPVDVNILKFNKHPGYRPEPYKKSDIAAVELEKTVDFNDYILPICILNQKVNQAVITGWGSTFENYDTDTTSDVLRAAQVDVFPNEECSKKWSQKMDSKYWSEFLDSQMCASKMEKGDICGGDSGGPLQAEIKVNTNRTIYNAIGITSLNTYCGSRNFPSVFTRVSSYLDWIEEVVWDVKKTEEKSENKYDTETNKVKINHVQNFKDGFLFWYDRRNGVKWSM